MSRRMRAYYYAILGAIGGLLGWQVSNLLGLSFVKPLFLSEAVVGALIGLCVGLLIGAAEGLMTRNWARALRAGGFSGLLGLGARARAAAGAGGGGGGAARVGLFFPRGRRPGRVLGWGLFGLLLGFAEGVTGGTQVWKGALGGLLGGWLGGALLEGARSLLNDALAGQGLGMVLLGVCVGAFIALIVVLLSRSWLEVRWGKLKGNEFILDKFMKAGGPTAILGSDALKADIVLPDPDIAPQHARLRGGGAGS